MYYAEVYVIVKDDISFDEARWVGDSLTRRLSRMADIEHAYVHLDSSRHDPALERALAKGTIQGPRVARDQLEQTVFHGVDDATIV
jgi:hypothetical protein